MRLRRSRRPAMAALEVVLVTGIGLPIAAFIYFTFERVLDQFWFALGNAVGIPFM